MAITYIRYLGGSLSGGGGGGSGVSSLNGLTGALTLVAGTGITITPSGSNILISATGGSGTVTSVGLSAPASLLSVSGSPVTSSGTLALSLVNAAANTVWAGPTSGGPGSPSYRALVAADIPSLPYALDSFTIMQPDSGTSPTASSPTDTLTFHNSDGYLSISGNAGTKTLTFNTVGLQPSGNYITALTGDVTATGPGSAAATLATVNGSPGTYTYATITVNSKGLVTSASSGAAPTGTVTSVAQTTNSVSGLTVSGSPITTSGTLALNLAQATTSTNGYLSSTDWNTFNNKGSGTVTSVALADGSTTPIFTITGSPVTSSGTLTETLVSQSANTVFAGPISGGSTQPTFRALVAGDLPTFTANTSLYANGSGVIASVPASTKTYPVLLSQTNSGAPTFGSAGMIAGVPVTGLKFVNASLQTSATGDTDIYTVPSGKRSLLMNVQLYNTSAGTITTYTEVKISGTYYGLQGSIAVSAGTAVQSGNGTLAGPIFLEAGQTFSINTTTNTGLNVWYQIAEFDNTAACKSSVLTSFTTGYNTIYTAPSGKSARLLAIQEIYYNITSATAQTIFLYAGTSGTFSWTSFNTIPNAGSGGTSNISGTSGSVTSAHSTRVSLAASFGSGDSLAIDAPTTSNSGAMCWVNLLEI